MDTLATQGDYQRHFHATRLVLRGREWYIRGHKTLGYPQGSIIGNRSFRYLTAATLRGA